MTQPSTIRIARLSSKVCKIKFSNPPTNLIVPETVNRLHEVVKELSEDENVQVIIFITMMAQSSAVPSAMWVKLA